MPPCTPIEPSSEQVKRPANAYMQWYGSNRVMLTELCVKEGLKGVGPVAQRGSAMWKALPEADRAPWEAKYQEQKVAFEAFKATDAFEPPVKKEKKAKKGGEKAEKDPDAPKRLVGGAFGLFQKANREDFVKQAEQKGYSGFGGPSKIASESWKALPEAQQGEWQSKYEAAKVQYDKDFEAYGKKKEEDFAALPQEEREKLLADKEQKISAEKAEKTSPKKRKAQQDGSDTQASKMAKANARGVVTKGAKDDLIDPEVLVEVRSAGLEPQFMNLYKRPELQNKNITERKMLEALVQSEGLVNKAKAFLLQ